MDESVHFENAADSVYYEGMNHTNDSNYYNTINLDHGSTSKQIHHVENVNVCNKAVKLWMVIVLFILSVVISGTIDVIMIRYVPMTKDDVCTCPTPAAPGPPTTATCKCTTGASFTDCPYTALVSGCYHFATDRNRTWQHAYAYCEGLGGYLVIIDEVVEQTLISGQIFDSRCNGCTEPYFWIGLTDQHQEGEYTWIKTGKLPNVTFWSQGQPDYSHEDCVVTPCGSSGQWCDVACGKLNYAVCEFDVKT